MLLPPPEDTLDLAAKAGGVMPTALLLLLKIPAKVNENATAKTNNTTKRLRVLALLLNKKVNSQEIEEMDKQRLQAKESIANN